MSLISTYDVRIWAGTKDGDVTVNPKIAAIIDVVEDFVDSYTNRKLEAKRYATDPSFCYIDGTGFDYVYLAQYPVSYVASVNMDGDRVFGSGTLFASADYYWYPSGKLQLSGGAFFSGRRNILVDYTAGYAPVVGGTHNASVSTYPLPSDLKQVMVEMCVQAIKEGIAAIHSVQGAEGETKMMMMLNRNTFWRMTLEKHKAYDVMIGGRDQ